MSVVDHLDELRSRLILCVVAFCVAWALTAWQNHLVLEIVNAPLPNDIEPITLGPSRGPPFLRSPAGKRKTTVSWAGDPFALRTNTKRRTTRGEQTRNEQRA